MSNPILTRIELYDLVWSIPMTKLSKRFATTDNKLRTICRKMSIPIPKTGYWQQIKYGKQVEIPDLPPENSTLFKSTIELFPLKEPKVDRLKQIKEDIEKSCKYYLKVKRKLVIPDKVTTDVQNDLEGRIPSHFGKEKGYISTYRYPIRFFVTPKNAFRALRILDAFVKLVRARNHKISLNGLTYEINIRDEKYEFGIREKQVRLESTDQGYAYNYKATGLLVLSTGRFWGKKEYTDGKILLEKQLSTIVAELEYRTELRQEEMKKHRVQQSISDEKRRLIQEEINRKEIERESFKVLLKQAKRWHKANIIREYIDRFEENSLKNNTFSEETKNWLSWARTKADWYDPIKGKEADYLTEDDLQKL
jgi:hypothetical protein